MKYGTQTRLKYLYPFVRKSLDSDLSPIAKKRLKWMLYIFDGHSVAKCSRHFDIPLRTIWLWYKRFDIHNLKSLENKSRKPKNFRYSPVPLHQRNRVIELRKRYPAWGKIKIQKLLSKEGIHVGQTRIQTLINQSGLKRIKKAGTNIRRNRRHMYSVPKECIHKPGGLVYMDVKHLYLPGGYKVYQFTAIDHATRQICAKVYSQITSQCGGKFLLYVKERMKVKEISYVGSDNGSEFLGFFNKVLSEQNITHVYSSPRTPKQNPFVERVIRTIIDELYAYRGLEVSIEKQQERLDQYIFTYNNIRPHQSLNLETPFEIYVKLSQSRTM